MGAEGLPFLQCLYLTEIIDSQELAHSHICTLAFANIHSYNKYFSVQHFDLSNCPILQATTALKQIASILLLGLLFFNWYGYRLVSDYLQQKSDTKLEAKLDNNDYDESQLIELRVPINLPYHNDWNGFERFNGEIEINGVHYKYVKRKVEKGELVLLCLPNSEKQLLRSARDNFFKLVNDLQQNNSGKKSDNNNSSSLKGLFSDYLKEKNNWTLALLSDPKTNYTVSDIQISSSYFSSSPEQPPEEI